MRRSVTLRAYDTVIRVHPFGQRRVRAADDAVGLVRPEDTLDVVARFPKWDVFDELVRGAVSEPLDPLPDISLSRIVASNGEKRVVVEVVEQVVQVPASNG